jgi:hypothetical protein
MFNNTIILQRRCWYIPKSVLPFNEPDENNGQYFMRLNEWRQHLNIPNETFIHISDRHEMRIMAPEKRKNLSPDDYKPQYISFANPFLVKLFEKSIQKVPRTLKVMEMLPNPQQLIKIGKHKHVIECLIQGYSHSQNHVEKS